MPSVIPPTLATYVEACLNASSQTLVTSVLSTPSTWLCLRLVYAALHGSQEPSRDRGETGSIVGSIDSRPVILVSLLRPLSLWTEMGRKLGLDVPSLLWSKKIIYVDGLSLASGLTATSRAGVDGSLPPTLRLKSLGLDDIRDAVMATLGTVSTLPTTSVSSVSPPSRGPQAATLSTRIPPAAPSTSAPQQAFSANTKPVMLLDGVDFLLASAPDVSALALGSVLATFRAQCHALVVTANADAPLLHTATSQGSGSPLERDHAHFLASMAHQSRWVWQLRGLDTGSARDVTGVLRLSRGGQLDLEEEGMGAGVQPNTKGDHMPDAEWLYQVKGDGSVKVWSRGE